MRKSPPPASLRDVPQRGGEVWICYYCEKFFLRADFASLAEREVWTCERCGHVQVLGKDKRIRKAARTADAKQPIVGSRAEGHAVPVVSREMREFSSALQWQQHQQRHALMQKQLANARPHVSEKLVSEIRNAMKQVYRPSMTSVAADLGINRKSKTFIAAWYAVNPKRTR